MISTVLEVAASCTDASKIDREVRAQQILKTVADSFAFFKKLDKKYQKGELHFRPKAPDYRKKLASSLFLTRGAVKQKQS